MATQRARNRRLEQVVESQSVRRSPRLSGRFPTHREESISQIRPSYSISSRQSLRSYGRGKTKKEEVSILNESGQSVPASFDDEVAHKGENVGNPPHLFGLDESDSESTASSLREGTVEHEEPTVVYTPRRSHPQPKGILPQAALFVKSALYKSGSLIYLAATGVLCLDVIILNRFFNYGKPSQRGPCYYLFLPLVLASVILFLLGGGLIPPGHEPEMPPPHQDVHVDMRYIMRTVNNTMRNELSAFKSSFKSDMQGRLEDYINLTIHTRDIKTNLVMKEESARIDRVLAQNKEDLLNQLNDMITNRVSVLEARLKALQDAAGNSSLAEASVRDIAREVASEEISAAKPEWLATAKQQLGLDITSSVDNLRQELQSLLNDAQANLTKQLDLLSKRASSLEDGLQNTQETITSTTNDLNSVKTRLDTHDSDIKTLKKKQKEIFDDIAQFKDASLGRISALEAKSKEAINAEQAVAIFYEELDKTLANENSALRKWLADNVASADSVQDLQRIVEKIQTDSPPGGITISDVEKVMRMALDRYSADRIGKFDFALENSGGSVILDKCSPTFPQSLSTVTFFGIPLWRTCVAGSAKLIIQPQVYPGDCWALNGTSGYATIQLKDKILVTEVSVEHIPKELSPNKSVDSAPKKFSVYGLSSVEDAKGTKLGQFTYDINGTPIQQFKVQVSNTPFGIVKFSFETNHGNPAYTCVYRVRVHGRYPK